MLASAAVNLGMASMNVSKHPQSPPPLPERPPIGYKTPNTSARSSQSSDTTPALISLSSVKHIPPPLPSHPPKSSLNVLETTDLDFDGE